MRPDDPVTPDPADEPSDYSYDMAHDLDDPSAADARSGRPSTARRAGSPDAGAPDVDTDGDYSYDLAHEVPPA